MQKFTSYFIVLALIFTFGAYSDVSHALTVDDGGSTAGAGESDGGSDDSSNDTSNNSSGGSTRRSSGGSKRGSNQDSVIFSDINFSRAGSNSLRVSWSTSIPSYGRIVVGDSSVANPTIDPVSYYGYQTGSAFGDVKTTDHTATAYLVPGGTYYIRLVASTGESLIHGPELVANPVASADAPRDVDVDVEDNSDGQPTTIDLSKLSTTTPIASADSEGNAFTAAVGEARSGVARFFSELYGMLFGKLCK